jgi:diguanylate cyclase
MVFELLINFCILFTFAVLSYWPFQDAVRSNFPLPKTHPYIIGFMAGLAGFILLETSVRLSDTILLDGRHVVIVISGIFGGPIAPIISGFIIGVARMFMTDEFTTTGLLAGWNIIIMGVVIGAFSFKYRMNFKNAHLYFYYATAQTALLIIYLSYPSMVVLSQVFYFVIYSAFSFFTVLFILIELNEHFKKIRHTELLSETDYLTGLYNNRKFHQLTDTYINDSTKPFSMISIDIDSFKKVNDIYGHPAGDEILKQLGKRLKDLVSESEGYVTRNGGEQFAVLIANSPPAMGLYLGERIRSSVASTPFLVSDDQEVSITVSVGVSSYPDNGSTIQALYSAADAAMYEAKANGRNRVIHFTNKKA